MAIILFIYKKKLRKKTKLSSKSTIAQETKHGGL
jgi:hypothetical protein